MNQIGKNLAEEFKKKANQNSNIEQTLKKTLSKVNAKISSYPELEVTLDYQPEPEINIDECFIEVDTDEYVEKDLEITYDKENKNIFKLEENVILESGQEIPILDIEVNKVKINKIEDVYGKLSDIVDLYLSQSGVTTIPLVALPISNKIDKLKRHQIFKLNDYKFAMSQTSRQDIIQKYKDNIIHTLECGIPFRESLITNILINNESYTTLKLNEIEWSTLVKMFEDYNSSVIKTADNLYLIVKG